MIQKHRSNPPNPPEGRAHTSFGEMLSSIRLCKGCSPKMFAEILMISPEELTAIENGLQEVSLAQAIAFSKALSGSPEMFVQYILQDQADRAGLQLKVSVAEKGPLL